MSDPIALSQLPTLEERMDDIGVVLDTLELERVTLNGIGDGGPLALLFAATYPERVDRLICYSTYARMTGDVDYPIGIPSEVLEELISAIPALWGTGWMVNILAPSLANGPFLGRWARFETSSASPGQAQAIVRRTLLSDVRPALAAITAPTLVIHRTGDRKVPIAMGRYLAEHIAKARFIELPGEDALPFVGDVDSLIAEVEDFVTGQRSSFDVDRLLATVLLTDIVDSTRLGSDSGVRTGGDYPTTDAWSSASWSGSVAGGQEYGGWLHGHLRRSGAGHAVCLRHSRRRSKLGIEIRAGLHTGEVEVRGADIAGIAVHLRRESRLWHSPVRFWSHRRFRPWLPGRESPSSTGVNRFEGCSRPVEVIRCPRLARPRPARWPTRRSNPRSSVCTGPVSRCLWRREGVVAARS